MGPCRDYRQPSPLQAPQQTGQGDCTSPAQGLASEDIAVDLSSGTDREALSMVGYIALIHKDENTSYGVSFPDVPGCISAGDTLDEALANAAEALAGHLALMREDSEAEPVARSPEAIRADPEFADDLEGALLRSVSPERGVKPQSIGYRRAGAA
jgi:predicted RNase H-like HicB family nuclease